MTINDLPDNLDANRIANTEAAMVANGAPLTEVENPFAGYGDFWGEPELLRSYLPDGKQYIEYRAMNEGERRKYQSDTAAKLTMHKASESSSVTYNPARDREALINQCVKDWFVIKNGAPVKFGDRVNGFHAWILRADPAIVEKLERDIRKANTWMEADLSVEDIDEQIDELREKRDRVAAAQAGESASSSK